MKISLYLIFSSLFLFKIQISYCAPNEWPIPKGLQKYVSNGDTKKEHDEYKDDPTSSKFFFGIGNLNRFINKVQIDKYGHKNKLSEVQFKPYASIGAKYHILDNTFILPEFSITIPQSGRDENIKKVTYFTLLPLGYLVKDFIFRVGAGIMFTRISSGGGTERLNNGGQDQYTSFPLPDGSSTSSNVVALIGLEYFFIKDWFLRAETLVYEFTDKTRRTFNYTLSVHHQIEVKKLRKLINFF